MMGCDEARGRWNRRFDGGGEDAGLDEHLASCDECRDYDGQMSQITNALDGLRDQTERIVARGDSDAPADSFRSPRSSRFLLFGRLARVAAVAIVAVGTLYLAERLTPNGEPKDSVTTPGGPAMTQTADVTIRLEGESAAGYLAVVRPTSDANVQMVWLYLSLTADGDDADSKE